MKLGNESEKKKKNWKWKSQADLRHEEQKAIFQLLLDRMCILVCAWSFRLVDLNHLRPGYGFYWIHISLNSMFRVVFFLINKTLLTCSAKFWFEKAF